MTIILLYRENNKSPLTFTQHLQWIIARHNPNVDFNQDFFKGSVVLKFLSRLNFAQIASEPTHIRASLLDHIYLKDDLINSHLLSSLVKSVHFSNHETEFVLKTQQNL